MSGWYFINPQYPFTYSEPPESVELVRTDHSKTMRYVPERTCEVEGFDDGADEALDGEWISYAPPTWYLSCGHTVEGSERPRYCSTCGARVKEVET